MKSNNFNQIKDELKANRSDFEMLLSKLPTTHEIDRSIKRQPIASPFFRWIFVGVAASAAAFLISVFNFNSTSNSSTDINAAILAVNEAANTNRVVINSSVISDEF